MFTDVSRATALAAVLMVALTGCTEKPSSGAAARPPRPAPSAPGVPVPVLKVGDPFAVDLLGDGRATVTVLATEVSTGPVPGDRAAPPGKVQLVATVSILLDKAGRPVTGGPQNFRFRDVNKVLHSARTNGSVFAPELAVVNLTTTGQRVEGKITYDITAGVVDGGQIQLTTGRVVHAIWNVRT